MWWAYVIRGPWLMPTLGYIIGLIDLSKTDGGCDCPFAPAPPHPISKLIFAGYAGSKNPVYRTQVQINRGKSWLSLNGRGNGVHK